MNFWRKIPLARIGLFFLFGIFISTELKFKLGGVSIIASITILLLILFSKYLKQSPKKLRFQAILWLVLFLVFGIWRGEFHRAQINQNWITKGEVELAEQFILELEGEVIEKTKSYKVEGRIIGFFRNDSLFHHSEKILCYFSKEINTESIESYKEIITSRPPSFINPPRNPGEFNYKKYLSGLGIQAQFYLDSASLTVHSHKKSKSFMELFISLKKSALSKLRELGIKDEAFGVIAALVLGEKDFLDSDTYNAYGAAGATHVLAVSGLHVGLIYVILLQLCAPLKRKKFGRITTLIIGLMGLWFYAALTGFSPSVLRASTMFTVILISQQLQRGSSIYNTLAISAIVLLFIWPNLLMEVGFQLSYSAVLGILLIQPWLYRLWIPHNWILDKAWQLSTVSIAAQLGTFPLGMLYFHQFPNYFLLSNLFVIPAATFILYLTLLTLLVSFINPMAKLLAIVLQKSVECLNFCILKIQSLPYAISSGIDISNGECFLLYATILSLSIGLINKRMKILKYSFILGLAFLALQCRETIIQSNQNFMVIHSVRNERVVSIVEGTKCYLISDDDFLKNKEKIKFHISHFWDKNGIKETAYVDINSLLDEGKSFILKDGILFFQDMKLKVSLNNEGLNSSVTHELVNNLKSSGEDFCIKIIDGSSKVYKNETVDPSFLDSREFAILFN